jgi:hypothetical protein
MVESLMRDAIIDFMTIVTCLNVALAILGVLFQPPLAYNLALLAATTAIGAVNVSIYYGWLLS